MGVGCGCNGPQPINGCNGCGNGCYENTCVTQAELGYAQQINVKDAEIARLNSEKYTDNNIISAYRETVGLFKEEDAKISSIVIDDAKKVAEVYMENDQVSLAIGKGGYNIKLAGKLTGYEIDVYRNTEEAEMEDDVDLKEFVDEIDEWIIDSLRNMGCDTAKSVLAYTAEEIATRADLEIETVVEIIDILKAEFEDDEQ